MEVKTECVGGEGVIRMSGRFDLHSHADFRTAYRPLVGDKALSALVIDFSAVDYIDSSALGQLLLLQQVAGDFGKEIVLANCGPSLRRAIEIANFHKIFKMR